MLLFFKINRVLINTKITRCKTFVILLYLYLLPSGEFKKTKTTCSFYLSQLYLKCYKIDLQQQLTMHLVTRIDVNWCMFCVFIDSGSYDVLLRLHLSAYFLYHVPNDRVTFYDMHSSVFNIEVLSSSHLFICNTRLLFFLATHFWYNLDRADSGASRGDTILVRGVSDLCRTTSLHARYCHNT